jgi:hypothetical protein
MDLDPHLQSALLIGLAALAGLFGFRELRAHVKKRAGQALALKRKIDGWQQQYGQLGEVCARWQLPGVSLICGKVSSLAAAETIKTVRDLRKKVSTDAGMLEALTECFYFQLPKRAATDDAAELDRLAEAVVKEPALMDRVVRLHFDGLREAATEIELAQALARSAINPAPPADPPAGDIPPTPKTIPA